MRPATTPPPPPPPPRPPPDSAQHDEEVRVDVMQVSWMSSCSRVASSVCGGKGVIGIRGRRGASFVNGLW